PFPYTTLFRSSRGRRPFPCGPGGPWSCTCPGSTAAGRLWDNDGGDCIVRNGTGGDGLHGAQLPGLRGREKLADGSGHPVSGSGHQPDRKSTRLNSSHVKISYAVFCLKKKK